jgi:type IV pilus assembly protein PilM
MRILGIDLGSTSIKAVEIDSAFGRFEIHDYHEHKIEEGEDPSLAINRLMQALPKPPDRIAVALPTRQLTFRNLRLPTRDRKAIQSSVGFELDDELPFAIDKAIYDYSVLSQSKQGTEVHVAATLRPNIAKAVETWSQGGVDPDLITSESWAYRAHLNRTIPLTEQNEPILLAQIGDQRTTLYVHWRGTPILAREIPWGGHDLTQAIASKYNLPLEQAKAAKLDHGFVVTNSRREDLTPEQVEFSEALMTPIRELISEFRQAEFTCKNATHHALSRIYLAGGTVLLPGFAKVIEDTFSIPTRPLRGLSSLATSGVTYSDHSDSVFLLAASIALCLVGTDRASQINFRKEAFAKKGASRELNFTTLKRPLLAAGTIGLSLFASMLAETKIYDSRLKEADTQLEKALRSFFGRSISDSGIKTYKSNTNSLRTALNKELTKQREIARLTDPNPHSPLDFLKRLSTAIPKDVGGPNSLVDLIEFQVGAAPSSSYLGTPAPSATPGASLAGTAGDSAVSLTFIVPSQQTAEKLAELLTGPNLRLSGLQKGKAEEVTAPGGTKNWKVTFTGKATEESYGK